MLVLCLSLWGLGVNSARSVLLQQAPWLSASFLPVVYSVAAVRVLFHRRHRLSTLLSACPVRWGRLCCLAGCLFLSFVAPWCFSFSLGVRKILASFVRLHFLFLTCCLLFRRLICFFFQALKTQLFFLGFLEVSNTKVLASLSILAFCLFFQSSYFLLKDCSAAVQAGPPTRTALLDCVVTTEQAQNRLLRCVSQHQWFSPFLISR